MDSETVTPRRPGEAGGSKWLPTLVLEIGSIVVGVLLALAVNQWNETRKNEAAAREALGHVAHELAANRDVIERVHAANVAMLSYLDTASADSDSSVNFTPGIQVRDNAWRTLIATGASGHVDYQMLLPISEAYSFQQVYKTFAMQLTQAYLSASLQTAANGQALDETRLTLQMQPALVLLTSIEGHLLDTYGASLDTLAGVGIHPREGSPRR